MVRGYRTSLGTPDLQGEVGLTPRQYTEWNVAGCALALPEIPLSRGCCLKCTVLPVQGGVLTYTTECLTSQRTINKEPDPRSCARVVFIAGDTLRQQPIGAGHMTVLQLHGPMGSRALPWWLFIAGDTLCHQPMRTGHMTVLQLCRLMEFRVLQWCHPMLASTTRTSCCTRMITLYGARKWIQARANRLPFCKNRPWINSLHQYAIFMNIRFNTIQ